MSGLVTKGASPLSSNQIEDFLLVVIQFGFAFFSVFFSQKLFSFSRKWNKNVQEIWFFCFGKHFLSNFVEDGRKTSKSRVNLTQKSLVAIRKPCRDARLGCAGRETRTMNLVSGARYSLHHLHLRSARGSHPPYRVIVRGSPCSSTWFFLVWLTFELYRRFLFPAVRVDQTSYIATALHAPDLTLFTLW